MYARNGAASPTTTFLRSFAKRRCLNFQRTFVATPQWRQEDASLSVSRGSDYDERVRSLKEGGDIARCYPRFPRLPYKMRGMSASQFNNEFGPQLLPGHSDPENLVQISGRVTGRRSSGSKLFFYDIAGTRIEGPGTSVQVVCNRFSIKDFKERPESMMDSFPNDSSIPGSAAGALNPKGIADAEFTSPMDLDIHETVRKTTIQAEELVSEEVFKDTCQTIRVGDWISVHGYPHRTSNSKEQLSLLATSLPILQAPRLHQLPDGVTDAETINRRFHVKMITQPRIKDIMRLRMLVEDSLDFHCKKRGLTRVHTPIIGASSGGAAADPFETSAKELSEEKLTLRIAPELYLKRLMIGDMVGVYEIGPAFRNEGVDATHNPEFTICEYYQRYARLRTLMLDTENLLHTLVTKVHAWQRKFNADINMPYLELPSRFPCVPFIPVLNRNLREELAEPSFELPDLEGPNAMKVLHEIYDKLKIPLPSEPTLPRILDDLSGRYLEPGCIKPTWIFHQPACLAPLAKSFIDEETGQHVSARAELFIGRREYVNCYEEENSPFEQRTKFLQQRAFRALGDDAAAEPPKLDGIEENYIEALEWGLPPTGGWGCGVDRLIMLFAGVDRIADVLPFGTLRNVVAMGKPLRK